MTVLSADLAATDPKVLAAFASKGKLKAPGKMPEPGAKEPEDKKIR